MTIYMYAAAMAEAAASGDVEQMRELARQAEEHVREYGNISAALEMLRAEIAKAEKGQSGGQ